MLDLDSKAPIKLNLLDKAKRNSMVVPVDPAVKAEMIAAEGQVKRKRGRPRKADKEESKLAEAKDSQSKAYQSPNAQYVITNPNVIVADQYGEVSGLLRHSIRQIDELAYDAKQALDQVKNSRTQQGKYRNISDLTQSITSLISSKLNAINQMRAVITDANNLELKRMKQVTDANQDKSSDQQIMELYQKMISMPTSIESQMGMVPMSQVMFAPNTMLMTPEQVEQFNQPIEVTPEMNRMMLEGNGRIKTVVRYDPSTTIKQFDVIDTVTGESVPNCAVPSQMELDHMQISEKEGVAYNSNLNTQYELVYDPSIANKF